MKTLVYVWLNFVDNNKHVGYLYGMMGKRYIGWLV